MNDAPSGPCDPGSAEGDLDPADRAAALDAHVGTRIRERRTVLGISQQQLAATLGLTYQQAHKYERGHNRISAGRLYEIAEALAVPVSWFYEGAETADDAVNEPSAQQRQVLELARNFAAIENERHQEAVSHLARTLAETGDDGAAEADRPG